MIIAKETAQQLSLDAFVPTHTNKGVFKQILNNPTFPRKKTQLSDPLLDSLPHPQNLIILKWNITEASFERLKYYLKDENIQNGPFIYAFSLS